jgi:hypothetical protein
MHSMPHPRPTPPAAGHGRSLLDKLLPVLSVFTMVMTVPQVWVACIGWVLLDAAAVLGVVLRG